MSDDAQLGLDGSFDGEAEATKPTSASTSDDDVSEASDASQPLTPAAEPIVNPSANAESAEAVEAGTSATAANDPESATVAEEAAPSEAEPRRPFYLTNRMNLNGVLSSRMLAPRESFEKYYSDLLELCPGWVPLLIAPPPAELIERVVAERGAGTPVLIELSESALDGEHPHAAVVYVRAALLSDVKAIHFRDKRSLREHQARGYDNVHPHDELLRVSPELFESGTAAEIHITAPEEAGTTNWQHLDKVRGAISAVLAAADSGEALAVAAGVLGAQQLPEGTVVPSWLTWDGLTSGELTRASDAPAQQADQLIFQTAYRVLDQRDQAQSWSPSDVLETVASEIAAGTPGDEAHAIIERNLQRIRELINVEREFEPFRNPGSPYVSAKAFLMTLLRPDLGQLLDWSMEETGADVTTRLVAAVLAGCLRGVARESVALRNKVLDDMTAAWAVRTAHGDTAPVGKARFVSDASKTALLFEEHELRVSTPLVPNPVSLYEALNDEARKSARVEVSRRLKWPVDVRVQLPAESEVQREDSIITITAIETVTVETSVDERAFLERLRALTGRVRQLATDALAQAK